MLHIPHDSLNATAIAPLPGGGMEIVTGSGGLTKVMRSRDDGLSWTVVAGAGLEVMAPADLVYAGNLHPGRFFIATNGGIWTYDPLNGEVITANTGLEAGDLDVIDLAVPEATSDGPVLAVTFHGNVYGWDDGLKRWRKSLVTGMPTRTASVAVSPRYSSTAPNGPLKTVAAIVNGVLYLSTDGGLSWQTQAQFSVPAADPTQWRLMSMAFAEDYATSGILCAGSLRQDPRYGGFSEIGEMWRSSDFGASFTRVAQFGTGIETMCATPPDGNGARHFFAFGPYYFGRPTGFLRSDDGGLTWTDFGSGQDLATEEGSGPYGAEVHGWQKYKQACAVSPYYAQDSMLINARLEGLWQTKDNGVHWTQKGLRSDREARDVAMGMDQNGALLAFGSGYGSAVVVSDLSSSDASVLGLGCPMAYQKEIEISPNYAQDGMIVVGGVENMLLWFSPRVALGNPYNTTGWVIPPLADGTTGDRVDGYIRVISISPNFDARGVPGSDRTLYWCSWEQPPYRSEDCGLTGVMLDRVSGGATMTSVDQMTIAPTYDASTAAGRSDVYASRQVSGDLFRLNDTEWTLVYRFPSLIMGVVADPTFSRPANPRVFVALRRAPYMAILWDYASGPVMQPMALNLGTDTLPQDIAAAPDFGARPVVYMSSWAQGLLKLDLTGPSYQWQTVGTGYPGWYVQAMTVSPNFASDRTVVLATQYGLLATDDRPGSTWNPLTHESWRDNDHPDLTPYAPNDPANPMPDRPFEWNLVSPASLGYQIRMLGRNARRADFDGSYVTGSAIARQLVLHTAKGPGQGAVMLSAEDYFTGAPLGSVSENLGRPSGGLENADVTLVLPGIRAVRLRVDVQLAAGESFIFDGICFER
ncbi:MAG: hypothetical protein EYC70_16555 [Planctomycetota bacterium]|nr:MAG: hypothetical protein EYC70_16555 [Planctomycetota bacterium]